VRKTHCQGRKHKENVRDYYQKWMEEQAQKLVCGFLLNTFLICYLFSIRLIKQQRHINPEN
jgi:hypothetical protein